MPHARFHVNGSINKLLSRKGDASSDAYQFHVNGLSLFKWNPHYNLRPRRTPTNDLPQEKYLMAERLLCRSPKTIILRSLIKTSIPLINNPFSITVSNSRVFCQHYRRHLRPLSLPDNDPSAASTTTTTTTEEKALKNPIDRLPSQTTHATQRERMDRFVSPINTH